MQFMRKFGPYIAVELLLPGGSLVALAMYLHQHRQNSPGALSISPAAIRLTGKKERANA